MFLLWLDDKGGRDALAEHGKAHATVKIGEFWYCVKAERRGTDPRLALKAQRNACWPSTYEVEWGDLVYENPHVKGQKVYVANATSQRRVCAHAKCTEDAVLIRAMPHDTRGWCPAHIQAWAKGRGWGW